MNDLVPVSELFTINYGNSLELINMEQCHSTDPQAIPFVSRTESNNGISAFVEREYDIITNPAHTLSVAVGGSVLSTFYQPLPYYTGFHVLVLSPKQSMTILEMLCYAKLINSNKYKYNYGRQANKTLKDIFVPSEISTAISNKMILHFEGVIKSMSGQCIFSGSDKDLSVHNKKIDNNLVKVKDLFDVVYGVNLELVNLTQCKSTDINSIPFISRTENNNGVSAFVEQEIDIEPNPAHTLSVAGGGSVLSTFYQPIPYYSGRDVYILLPKQKMKIVEMLFYANCFRLNKYKYNYGRQANKTLKDIFLPSRMDNEFIYNIELRYMKTIDLMNQYVKTIIGK
ncbi:MAG: restriction endonuclease subunit S, partial [Treponema sp.]|nr:restriction endonuclease subunit S [Treponema sp.]